MLTALGLHGLQHRGQEGCGIVSFDGARFYHERYLGLVGEHFSGADMPKRLPGQAAIGHTRYATQGGTILRNVQPLFADLAFGGFAIASQWQPHQCPRFARAAGGRTARSSNPPPTLNASCS